METEKIVEALKRCTAKGAGCIGCPFNIGSSACVENLHMAAAEALEEAYGKEQLH